MRLHRLRMTAIGPFADRVEIDFSRFGGSGLFLLEGPTGSGKSTVLDAISFALYGKLAQSTATAERLKSHHAPPTAEPVVELVFETQSGLYRVRRTPSHDRPKKRQAAGTTPVHMTVKLWRLGSADDLDGGQLLSDKKGDAEDEITRAVGLTHAQFVQTVLLPQGEFASFLHASTTDKRALLQRLFGTELLARTQLALIEERRAAEQRRAAASTAVAKAVHAFAGATGLAEDNLAELAAHCESGDCGAVIALLGEVRADLQAIEVAAAEQHAGARKVRLRCHSALQRAEDLATRRRRRQQLRAEQQELAAAAPQHRAVAAELAAAERALIVEPAADTLVIAISRSQDAEQAATSARARLSEPLAAATETQLRSAAAAHRTMLGTLADELRRERELISRRAEHEALERQLEAENQRLRRARDQLAELPARQAELTAARSQAALAASRLTDLRAERERAEARLVAAKQAVAAAKLATENQQLAQELFDAAERQRVRFETLQVRWRASIASELGLALQSGEECVVCGSVEHPKPARPTEGHVSQDAVKSAADDLQRLDAEVEQRRNQLAEQRATLVELEVRAEQLSPELARHKLDQATASLAHAQATADRLPSLDRELAEIDELISDLEQRFQQASVNQALLAERRDALSARISEDLQAVTRARGKHASVADRAVALSAEVSLIEAATAASAMATAAAIAVTEAQNRLSAALAAADFDDQHGWQQARRTSSELAGLRRLLRSYEQQVAAVDAQLATVELTDPELDAVPADLAALTDHLHAAEAAEAAAAAGHGAAQSRLAEAVSHAERLERSVRRGAKVLAETAAAIRLGNLVAGLGDNQLKMELTTYVLVRRFTEIIGAANSQLLRISEGRYELEHTSARSGNARSGLGLRVMDLHTGQTRDPGTLSGGETFYVSLALALGLADIVRAESGGLDLGTLLIDEGFGSLDPDVLDQVLAVLDGLRAGGRAVGVISHVEELKRRIADQIQVRANPDGSSRLLSTV